MPPRLQQQLSLCIKTFQRPQCLERLLHSIRTRYPNIPVHVADDSEAGLEAAGIATRYKAQYYPLPFDSGLSAGRNFLLEQVRTPYAAILDDDFVFIGNTNLENWLDHLTGNEYDLIAGRLFVPGSDYQHYEGFMTVTDESLVMARVTSNTLTIPCHIVLNFFAARLEALQDVRWDDHLKVYEHEDFFWRTKKAGVRVGYDPLVVAHHIQERHPRYTAFRNNRIQEMKRYVMEKHGWKDIRWVML